MTQSETLNKIEDTGLKILNLIDLYVTDLEKGKHPNINLKALTELINIVRGDTGKGNVSVTPDITRAYYQVSQILLKNQELKQKFGEVEEGELAKVLTQNTVEIKTIPDGTIGENDVKEPG